MKKKQESRFIFWYKKEITAPNLDTAIKMEKKAQNVLDSIEHKKPEESSYQAIGFRVSDDEDE